MSEWYKQIKCTHDEAEDHRGEETSDEALPGLLGGKLRAGGLDKETEAVFHINMTSASPKSTCDVK